MSRIPHQHYELRPLKTVDLLPPDYKISQHELIDGCLEKEVKFIGIISDIPLGLDSTNRTEVLRVIDQGKRNKYLPRTISSEHDAIFYLSARNIKLSTRDQNEDLILRLPIHQVAAMSHVREDDCHILCIKYGENDVKRHQMHNGGVDDMQTCHVAVLYCDSARIAEELCAVLEQCFQTVYTDATMHFFDRSLKLSTQNPSVAGAASVDYPFSDKSDGSTPNRVPRRSLAEPATLGFLSNSSLKLGSLSSATSGPISSTTGIASDGELSAAANELILAYMTKLYTKLNADELHRFALLVKAWHTDLSFADFCNGVYELYGPERKHLLNGMQPFIPAKDLTYFELFIERVGLSSSQSELQSANRGYRPPVSSVAWYRQTSGGDDSTEFDYDLSSEVSGNNERLGSNNSKP